MLEIVLLVIILAAILGAFTVHPLLWILVVVAIVALLASRSGRVF